MAKVELKIGMFDLAKLGLGYLSLLFDIPEWIQLTICFGVTLIAAFIALNRQQKTAIIQSVYEFFVKTLIPFLGGAFLYAVYGIIAINIADAVLNIHLIHHTQTFTYTMDRGDSWYMRCFRSLGHLTTIGYVIFGIFACVGGMKELEDNKPKRITLPKVNPALTQPPTTAPPPPQSPEPMK